MSFLRKIALVNLTHFVCLGIGILQTSILSRALGPTGVGQYTVILSALTLAVQLSSFGFPMSFLYHSQHDTENTNFYRINTIWAMLLLGTAGGIITAVIIHYNQGYFGEIPVVVLIGTVAYIPVMLQSLITRNNLMIKIEARRISLMKLATTVISVGIIVLLWAFGTLGLSQALFCFFAVAAIRLLFGAYWMRKDTNLFIMPKLKTNLKLGWIGIKLSTTDLAVIVNGQLNVLIIKYLIDDFASVGFFSRGQRIAMLAVIAGQAIMPMLFSKWASIEEKHLTAHIEKVMRFASTISIFMIFAILLTSKWIILILYGREFLPALVPMMILLPGTVLYLASSALIRLLGSRGKPETATIILFIATIVNALLNFILIPILGIKGAAAGATVSNIVLLVLLVITCKTKYNIKIKKCFLINKDDIKSIKKAFIPSSLRQ